MKKIALFLLLASFSFSATAHMRSAKYDATKGAVIVDVVFSGGCATHDFQLRLNDCQPVNSLDAEYVTICQAEVRDVSLETDRCGAEIFRTISFSLSAIKDSMRPMLLVFAEREGEQGQSLMVLEKNAREDL